MLVTVGIHVHAEPNRLRETLAAFERPGRRPIDLLLLPDGPDAPTVAALAELGDVRQSPTDHALGAPGCFNRLARETTSDVVVLLESGAVPAPGAIDLLVDVLARDRRVGLAGPSTNQAWNEQCAFPGAAGGATIEATSREAVRRFRTTTRPLAPLHSIGDFCLAVRREVIDAIGGTDEGYGLGPCWEMEYSVRAARAGFRDVWVGAAYVWRPPFTPRRALAEQRRFDASRRRYQDSVCRLRLDGTSGSYEPHCRGEGCEHFAPLGLIRLHRPLAPQRPGAGLASAPPSSAGGARLRHPPVGGEPLVTCVMPTRNRAELALHAIELFHRQDYRNRELIVVDDGDDGLEARLPRDPSIRYLRAPRGESIGAKRNRACASAAGAFIAQWDDDDWYGPGRLSAQIEPLTANRADISGMVTPVFFDLPRWHFWAVSPQLHARLFVGNVHGGTLVFARALWDRGVRYPDASLAEDAALLTRARASGARLERVDGSNLFMYLRHANNAWHFECGAHVDRAGWRLVSEPELPAGDRAFYAQRSVAMAGTAAQGPMVSCLMPTRDRRPWIAQSIKYFQRQDYPHRELVILDDGEASVRDLVPADPRVRYVRLEERLVLGEKRNRACELARGEIIAHWDDDDWHCANRLSYQVEQLQRHGAALCGPGRVIFFDPFAERAWQYEYPRAHRAWVHGAAMCYRRELWQENRFAHVPVGEDTRFVWNPRIGSPLVLADHRFYAGLVHRGNTSRKVTTGSYWQPHSLADIRSLLGDDYGFYERSAHGASEIEIRRPFSYA